MSGHNTEYPVWDECSQHSNPDEDERYECDAGEASCLSYPLFTIPSPDVWQCGQVLCATCTAFVTALDEYEETHDTGEDVGGGSITICKVRPPTLVCQECSEECGEWVKHQMEES